MQTILINAYCIGKELQGLLVQGYVQWIIADFATAYKKLDFTDVEDPMRVVNVQLREQAEAAIKDKVATMGIDEVLSDKQPIIEELTARLRSVAEGAGKSDTGLGLRIVTVQIKEAVVSSITPPPGRRSASSRTAPDRSRKGARMGSRPRRGAPGRWAGR
jgi:regulator of protease activity HflC (stomatin/prohibitin superfamily)